ncbi:GTPase-associated protein 1-related protein [Catellatospora sp. NPDC049111]|uniref:GTPase-associated protein 1-related protein n=1 Tax=Catellatospora sp. NPDC049111 TaxID=3155271 RepID=UPI00340B2F8F
MSAAFETLVYTDCRPGQGLAGTAGFQFQARSSGADQQAMHLVERHLLYEAPDNWMAARHPPEQYPPSLAHLWDDRLITAAGRYLGREANGGREGNQLTHAIVTGDPDSYGSLRPAQLFGAPFWTGSPAATTDCPPLPADIEPGGFGVQEAQDFLNSSPDNERLLAALVTTLERSHQPQATRILFICADPDLVLRWITLGTLLLPQRRALAINFKVFTTRPTVGTHHIVAVHPDWQVIDASVGNDHGFMVVDLVRGDWSDVEISPLAERWVSLFASADPYDILDAIEVAAASEQRQDRAPAIGLAAVIGRPPARDEVGTVVDWLRNGPAGQRELYGGRVTDLLVDTVERWPAAALAGLDQIATAGWRADRTSQVWLPERIAAVRGALLTAELRRARTQGLVADGAVPVLPPTVWGDAEQRAAVQSVAQALTAAEPAVFEAVLRVALRFGVAAPLGQVREAAHAFVREWADNPHRGYDHRAWSAGEGLRDLLHDELRARVRLGPEHARRAADGWWAHLLPVMDALNDELDEAVLAAAMVHLPANGCRTLMEEFLPGAVRKSATGRVVGVLFARRPASLHELRLLLEHVPRDTVLPDRAVAQLTAVLQTVGELPEAEVELAGALVQRGNYDAPPGVRRLLDAVAGLPAVAERLARAQTSRMLPRTDLAALPGAVARARQTVLRDALLTNPYPLVALEGLELVPGHVADAYARAVEAAFKEPRVRAARVTTAFLLTAYAWGDVVSPRVRDSLAGTLRRWTAWAKSAELNLVGKDLRALQSPTVPEEWEKYVREIKDGGWRTKFGRGSR